MLRHFVKVDVVDVSPFLSSNPTVCIKSVYMDISILSIVVQNMIVSIDFRF